MGNEGWIVVEIHHKAKATYEINGGVCSIGGPSSNHTFKYLYLPLHSSSRSAGWLISHIIHSPDIVKKHNQVLIQYVFPVCYVCSPVLLCLLCSWLVPCDPLLPVFVTLLSFYCSHFWILDNQLITAHLLYYLPASPFCHRDGVPAVVERMWPELIWCVARRWPLSAAFQLTDHLKSSESPLPREITLIGCSVKRNSAQEETWIKKGKARWVCCCGIHDFPRVFWNFLSDMEWFF